MSTTLDEYITDHARPYLVRTARALQRNLEALADQQQTSTLDPNGKAAQIKTVLDEARQQVAGVRLHIAHEVQEAERLGRPLPADLEDRAKPIHEIGDAILGVQNASDAGALVATLGAEA